jgi:hypothetical protein
MILLVLTEIIWGGDHEAEGVLKSVITSKKMIVEQKSRTPFPSDNYWNAIIDTNHGWAVPATLDNRRFFIPAVSNCKVGDVSYFTKLHKSINEDGGKEAFFKYLLQFEIPQNWRAANHLPRTRGAIEQSLHNRDCSDLKWLVEKIESGEEWIGFTSEENRRNNHRSLPIFVNNASNNGTCIPKSEVFESWRLEKIPHSKITTMSELTRFFKMYTGNCIRETRPRAGIGYTDGSNRPRYYEISPISEIKKYLTEKVFKLPDYFINVDGDCDSNGE